jgi:hypothetical protein
MRAAGSGLPAAGREPAETSRRTLFEGVSLYRLVGGGADVRGLPPAMPSEGRDACDALHGVSFVVAGAATGVLTLTVRILLGLEVRNMLAGRIYYGFRAIRVLIGICRYARRGWWVKDAGRQRPRERDRVWHGKTRGRDFPAGVFEAAAWQGSETWSGRRCTLLVMAYPHLLLSTSTD